MAIVGIDFGTTYSGVTIYRNGTLNNVYFNGTHQTSPSCVFFEDDGTVCFGSEAVQKMQLKPENGVIDIKRLIGRDANDETLNSEANFWPFSLVIASGKVGVEVTQGGQRKTFTPEELAGMYLGFLRKETEKYLDQSEIQHAVVSIPAYYKTKQRNATRRACEYAQLPVEELIHEPTAAVLSVPTDLDLENKKVLVYDFGGGTFDVTILKVQRGKFDPISIDGNSNLGGRDIDNHLCKYLKESFERTHKCKLDENSRQINRLRTECERIKIQLSSCQQTQLFIPQFNDGKNLKEVITRQTLERIALPFIRQTLEITQRAMTNENISVEAIDYVLLVGGTTRMPAIQDALKEKFGQNKVKRVLHPDLAVMQGAAIYCAHLANAVAQGLEAIQIGKVNPLGLGVELSNGAMSIMLKPNTKLPSSVVRYVTTYRDQQSQVSIKLYEGNAEMACDNSFLGQIQVDGIKPAPAGEPRIRVHLSVTPEGVMKVVAFLEQEDGEQTELIVNVSTPSSFVNFRTP